MELADKIKRIENAAGIVLDGQERDVFFLLWPLNGSAVYGPKEAGLICGISVSKVYRLKKRADQKVKEYFEQPRLAEIKKIS